MQVLFSPLEQFEVNSWSINPQLVWDWSFTSSYLFDDNYFYGSDFVQPELGLTLLTALVLLIFRIASTLTKTENLFFYVVLFVFAVLSSVNIVAFKDFISYNSYVELHKVKDFYLPEVVHVYYEFDIMGITWGLCLNTTFCFLFIYFLTYLLYSGNTSINTMKIIPSYLNVISESIYKATFGLFVSTLGRELGTREYFLQIKTVFLFLILSNVSGMIPFMSTITSSLANTFYMALALFISIIIAILDRNGFNYFLRLFMPPGCPIALIFLLIPIEIISYTFRVVSLSVRLFANMMAGHTLLKVIVGFSLVMILLGDGFLIANLFPVATLFILTGLEIGVAVIQAYIFTILSCIYIRDIFEGH